MCWKGGVVTIGYFNLCEGPGKFDGQGNKLGINDNMSVPYKNKILKKFFGRIFGTKKYREKEIKRSKMTGLPITGNEPPRKYKTHPHSNKYLPLSFN